MFVRQTQIEALKSPKKPKAAGETASTPTRRSTEPPGSDAGSSRRDSVSSAASSSATSATAGQKRGGVRASYHAENAGNKMAREKWREEKIPYKPVSVFLSCFHCNFSHISLSSLS